MSRIPGAGLVDRDTRVEFTFNGRTLHGHAGDTLASALLANDVHLVGRSYKYHRPRGILTAGVDEPNAIVQLERGAYTTPDLRATEIELYDGLQAASVRGSPAFDWRAVFGLASPILVAGFYNKTFKWPKSFWERVYEPALREAAGLGAAPDAADPDVYDRVHWHCDVLVVGAGPAGLAAALDFARAGVRVVLADEGRALGGSLLRRPATIDGATGVQWAHRVRAELESTRNALVLPRTTVFGYYDHNYLMALEKRTDHLGPGRAAGIARQRLWHIRAKHVVLATGALERPIVFGDNDLPGVVLASAACTYAHQFGVALGRRAVAFVNNDVGARQALEMHALSRNLTHIVDARTSPSMDIASAAKAAGVELVPGHVVVRANGGKRVNGVEVQSLSGGSSRRIECDHVLVSGGFNPVVHLFSQAPGSLRYDDTLACFVPAHSRQSVGVAGAANGHFGLDSALREARLEAARVLAGLGHGAEPTAIAFEDELRVAPLWSVQVALDRALPGKHFVDFQHDVSERDIRLAAQEGFRSVEHTKRYTTTGMATDQGKTSNVVALALLADTLAKPIPDVGTTTFRPPYTPITFGALAGRDRGELSDPARMTPMHAWHVEQGAAFENVGQWKRPWYYPRDGEDMHAAVQRESKAVRASAGVMDATTLGKIDIQGKDAAELLNRVYTNAWTKLGVGQCRYGVMCKPDGMVMDDGVTARLADDRFLMTTTTGNAARVLDWLEEWLQTEWPELDVYCTSVTEQWATVSVVGPASRKIMKALAPDLDVSNAAFPFMTFREATVAGIPARVFRISFSGELSYEINVAAWHGMAVWKAVMEAGRAYDITPYGTETMHVLRAEKGYIIIGQETDGTVTPQDLGMDWIVSKQKPFIGSRSFARADTRRAGRKQLVGLVPEDRHFVAPEGSHLVASPRRAAFDPALGSPSIGHVTSSYYSPNLDHAIALALVADGRDLMGETIHCAMESGLRAMKVVDPVFYDKEGKRRDGID
jgi:sarcosine oxidase subunit alpha